ncbi:DUF4230 domain-containing protein [Atopobium fossor]|uniref:DUF4230 domain-containing protein n=1 Tax=Atopobium fossor TaxID=39487 RepID=UPI0003F4EBE8|nr:DUF4230 domain-containing protein [Atopobium fossor]
MDSSVPDSENTEQEETKVLGGGSSKDIQKESFSSSAIAQKVKSLNEKIPNQKSRDKKSHLGAIKGIAKLFKMLGPKGTLIALAVVVAAIFLTWFGVNWMQPPIFISSSQLTKMIAVNQLSVIEYPYEGVADYTDGFYYEHLPVHMHYKATVNVSFNPEDVQWEIDNEKKIITPILPEFTHSEPVIDDHIVYLEDGAIGIDPKKAFNYCKQDAVNDIANKIDLDNMAVENAHAIIEGLTYNLVESKGYKIVWPEDMEKSEQKSVETAGDKNAA